ncbi:phage tail sheath subtilisin-like domain-containing protein [Streptomyces sp. N2-109]|uniref:Phage tail sheath subtilisin-like domain-containing protein n=1 Tax=Streptomyces gossypii TaxID=2883101 RepID=A0ABT2K185_9ACTN|nr:phage tail sheath subtilisin-like domain-containing protein [Streptomyces gossypii]MCT2593922.1 phage tail sheath subtilisin-like domain-containing protein [Streptomyces gossypii]
MPSYLSPGVYVEEVESGSRPIEGVGTSVAAFVGFAQKGPCNEPTLITNWTQFVSQFGEFVEGTYLANSVYGFFANGGGICYVVRIGAHPAERGAAGKREVTEGAQAPLGAYLVRTLPGVTGQITVEVADPEGEDPPQGVFALVVKRNGEVVETFPAVTTKRSKENVATQVKSRSRFIALEEPGKGAAPARPVAQTVTLSVGGPAGESVPSAPESVTAESYVGDADLRTGFGGLEAVEDVTMVAAPDLMSAYERGILDLESVVSVQQGLITHCEAMGDRIAILDPPPGLSPQQARSWRMEGTGFDSKYATMYYPWLKVFDPGAGRNAFVPPSGHIAGVWARNDDSRGVHKAPANEVVRGAVALQTQITKGEHDLLNPVGLNCVRAFPGRGIRVWGARTLAADHAWRYLNVRRLFNYLEESILAGTQWVVFEPNDDALWARVRRTVSAFLVNEWRKGALFGLTPDEAFYVKCDRETNPPEAIEAGQVICEVGVAPVKPAEFVVFRLAQLSSGTGAVDE